jgi:Nickel responsive protein SCO4226-like
MKNLFLFLFFVLLAGTFVNTGIAQDKSQKNSMEKVSMHRYVVERTFPKGLNIPINDVGKDICLNVVSTNAEDQVTWVQSYVTKDKKKTFCIYDAPSADAIRKAAKNNKLPVDKITEVSVLDPYFYK